MSPNTGPIRPVMPSDPNTVGPVTGTPLPSATAIHDVLRSPMAIALERAAYQAVGVAVSVAAGTWTVSGGDVKATVGAFLSAAVSAFLGRGIAEGHIDSLKARGL